VGKYTSVAEAQADGCLHYWNFDESTGAIFADLIDGYNGDVLNSGPGDPTATIAATDTGNGRDPAGLGYTITESVALITNNSNYAYDPNTELSAWTFRGRFFFRSIHDADSGGIVAKFGIGGAKYFEIFLFGGVIEIYTNNASHTHNSAMTPSTWYEIAITYDGSTLKGYINAVEVVSDASENTLQPYAANENLFGCNYGGTYSYEYNLDGIIDEFALWNRALSGLEISTLYSGGTATPLIESTPPPVLTPLTAPPRAATYKAILTGAPDSTIDLVLAVSSFSARLRNAAESYLQIVVPNARNIAEAIAARPAGELVVFQVIEGTETELARSNFGDMRADEGPRSGFTVTLSGHKYTTFSAADGHEIQKITYYSKSAGKSRIRCSIIAGVEPADTIDANGVQFIAGAVFLTGSTNLAYMEVSEA
jgi:hypothetical protein